MAKKNSDEYWKQREADERKWIESNIKNDADFDKIIQKHYDKLVQNINKDISDQYIKYAGREGISLAEAQKAVSLHDVQAFSSEAKEAVARAREIFKKKGSVAYSDFESGLNQRLRLYNATMRINRLEYLKANLGLELLNTNINIGSELAERLKKGYSDEVRRQAGILGEAMGSTNIKNVSKIVMAQTKNANFSDRLWANSDVLKTKLDGILTQQHVQGLSPKVIATKLRPLLADNVASARYVTERLARTESARVAATAQLDSFKKYGYDYVKWIAEPSACKVCVDIASTDDGVYPLKDVPYLPAHANCRCSISAWYNDGNVKAKGEVKDDIKVLETPDTDIIASFNKTNIKEAFGEEKYNQFKNSISNLKDEQLRKLYANYGQDLEFENVSKTGGNYASTSTVHLSNSAFEGDKIHEPMETVYHEIGHAIDSTSMNDVFGKQLIPTGRQIKRRLSGKTYTFDEQASHLSGEPSVDLGKTIKQDLFDYINHGEAKSPMQMGKKPRKKAEKAIWLEEDSKSWEGVEKIRQFIRDTKPTALENMKKYGNTSDIIEGTGYDAFDYPWNVGHGSKYWNDYGKKETEFFAEYTASRATNPASLALIKEIFPNAAKICDSLIDKMVEAKK